jgi:hypothetical protein
MNMPAQPGPVPTGEGLRGRMLETFQRLHGPAPKPSVLPLLPPPAPAREDYHPSLSGFGGEDAARSAAQADPALEALLADAVARVLPRLRQQLLDVLAEDIGAIIKDALRDRGL